jgi:hypothetical protein
MDNLGIHPNNMLCASALTGTVKKLNEDQAAKLRDALNRVLIPIVTKEFTRLQNISDLPHLRMVDAEQV